MRVILYGRMKPQYAKCPECYSILEFSVADMVRTPRHLSKGPLCDGKDYYVRCAVCGHKVLDGLFFETFEELNTDNLPIEAHTKKGAVVTCG